MIPMNSDKVVIVCAVNGGMQMDREGAKIPCTPDEIAKEAKRCYDAGAAVVHVHARDENKRNTTDINVFSEIITKIREICPVLIQTTNGSGVKRDPKTGELSWPSDDERLGLLVAGLQIRIVQPDQYVPLIDDLPRPKIRLNDVRTDLRGHG